MNLHSSKSNYLIRVLFFLNFSMQIDFRSTMLYEKKFSNCAEIGICNSLEGASSVPCLRKS